MQVVTHSQELSAVVESFRLRFVCSDDDLFAGMNNDRPSSKDGEISLASRHPPAPRATRGSLHEGLACNNDVLSDFVEFR